MTENHVVFSDKFKISKHIMPQICFLVLVFVMFVSVYNNIYGVAPSSFYKTFQRESETLVVGKIVADEYSQKLPHNANLGFASTNGIVYEPAYVYQSYAIIGGHYPNAHISLEPINDHYWVNGVSKNFPGIVVKKSNTLDRYVGRPIFLDDRRRIVASVEHAGGYSTIHVSGPLIQTDRIDTSNDIIISGERISSDLITFTPYLSQFGIQGIIFSNLYKVFRDVSSLYMFNAMAFSIVIVFLTFLYFKIFPWGFSAFFFTTIALSPWITSMAKNLYWVPFFWLLPATFASGYVLSESKTAKSIFLLFIYFSFVIKCLSGYEFISSVILLAAAPFLYIFIKSNQKNVRIQSALWFVIICFIGVAGFTTALLLHADIRGETIQEGLTSIYEGDVKRRTYGDPNAFGEGNFAALSSSPIDVVKTYLFDWNTELLVFVPGRLFSILVITAFLISMYRACFVGRDRTYIALFVAFLLPPISWFILAKGHSGVHTQINYVLWYLGFTAAVLYICAGTTNGAVRWFYLAIKKQRGASYLSKYLSRCVR